MQQLTTSRKLSMLISGLIIELTLGIVYAYSVLRVYLENELGLNQVESSIPYLLALFFFAFFVMISGRMMHEKSFNRWLILGITCVVSGYFLAAISNELILISLSIGLLLGSGVGILYGIPVKIVQNLFSKRKGLTVGLTIGGFGLSSVITAPLLQLSLEQTTLAQTFINFGIGSLIILSLFVSVLVYKTDARKLYEKKLDEIEPLDKKMFTIFFVVFMIGIMFGLSIIGLTSYIGIKDYNLSIEKISLWIILFSSCNGLSRPLFGYIYDRYKLKVSFLILILMTLFVSVFYLFVDVRNELLFVITMGISWGTVGGYLSVMPNLTRDLFGEFKFAKTYGTMYFSYGIAAIVGNLYTSFMIDQAIDFGMIFIPVIILNLIVAGFIFVYRYQPYQIRNLK